MTQLSIEEIPASPLDKMSDYPDLNEDHAKVLLKASEQRQTITLIIGERQTTVQSMLLGVDLYNYEILLGPCHPNISPAMQESLECEQAWLKIKSDETWLFIQVRLMTELGQGLLCSINDINQSLNQRLSPRLYFEAKDAPQVCFQSVKQGLLKGRLCDLSVHGAAIEFLGPDKNKLLNRHESHNFVFNFNEYFCPEIRARTVETRFMRNPCRLRVRIRFNALSDNVFAQLHSFIDTLN